MTECRKDTLRSAKIKAGEVQCLSCGTADAYASVDMAGKAEIGRIRYFARIMLKKELVDQQCFFVHRDPGIFVPAWGKDIMITFYQVYRHSREVIAPAAK